MEKGEQGLPNGKPWQLDSPSHWLCKAQTCCSLLKYTFLKYKGAMCEKTLTQSTTVLVELHEFAL